TTPRRLLAIDTFAFCRSQRGHLCSCVFVRWKKRERNRSGVRKPIANAFSKATLFCNTKKAEISAYGFLAETFLCATLQTEALPRRCSTPAACSNYTATAGK